MDVKNIAHQTMETLALDLVDPDHKDGPKGILFLAESHEDCMRAKHLVRGHVGHMYRVDSLWIAVILLRHIQRFADGLKKVDVCVVPKKGSYVEPTLISGKTLECCDERGMRRVLSL